MTGTKNFGVIIVYASDGIFFEFRVCFRKEILKNYLKAIIRCRGVDIVDIGVPTGFAPPIIYNTLHCSSQFRIPVGAKMLILIQKREIRAQFAR